jgi:hypothetical protein
MAVAVSWCLNAMLNFCDSLQQIIDVHIGNEDVKIRVAAIELHRQIVTSYPGNASTNLLPLPQLLGLISAREIYRIGCEILSWYLSSFDEFRPSLEELVASTDVLLDVVIGWQGGIKEAAELLHKALCLLPPDELTLFFDRSLKKVMAIEARESLLAVMRVQVETIAQRREAAVLRDVLLFVRRVQNNEETQRAARKAIEVLRQAIDPDVFTEQWTAILTEEEEQKKKKEQEREVEAELDPEAFKLRRVEDRLAAKMEERRRRWLTDTDERGVLHPFGPDGKRVQKVPLPPEFR